MTDDATDLYLRDIAQHGLSPDAAADLLPRWAETLQRHRAMLRRVEAVCAQLEERTRDPASVMWGAELRAAITGRKWLYRCPEHGDRSRLAQRHESGVCCGASLETLSTANPDPKSTTASCRWGSCTKTAVLIGEVDVP